MGQGQGGARLAEQIKQANRAVEGLYADMNARLNRYNDALERMDSENRKRARNTVRDKNKQYKLALKQMRKAYNENKKNMTKQDKQAYKLLYQNRVKDLQRLSRQTSRVFDDMADEAEDSANRARDSWKDFGDSIADLSLGMSINDISSKLEDQTKSNIELKNEIMKYSGMTRDELGEMDDAMKKTLDSLDYRFSNTDWLEAARDLSQMGIKDRKIIESLSKEILVQQSINGSSMDDLEGMIEMSQKTDLKDMHRWGEWIKALTSDGSLEVTSEALTGTFNDLYDSVWVSVKGNADEFNKRMASIMATTSAIENQWGDTSSLMDALNEIKSADPTQMVDLMDQYKYLGGGVVQSIKSQMDSGQIDKAMVTLSTGIADSMNRYANNPQMQQLIKNQFKDANLESIMKMNIGEINKDIERAMGDIGKAEGTGDLLQEALDNQITSPITQWINSFKSSGIGTFFENLSSSTGLDMTDALLVNAFVGNPAGKLLSKGGSALAGKLGLDAVAESVGTGGITALGPALAGSASTLAGGAGAIGAGLGIFSGLSDIVKSFGEDDAERKSQKRWSGGTKLGMVGTGAAAGAAIGSVVPVVGTGLGALVGAGVGGLGAMFKGSQLGGWLKNKWDGLTSVFDKDKTFDTTADKTKLVADSTSKMTKTSSRDIKNLESSLTSLSKTASSTGNSYSNSMQQMQNSSSQLGTPSGSSSSGGSSSGGGKKSNFKWYNPFTWFDGSHKDGLDRVPFDGYRAELHKDEAVLTAKEAKMWRNGENPNAPSGNSIVGFNSVPWFEGMSKSVKEDYKDAMKKFWEKQRQAQAGTGVGGNMGLGNINGNTQSASFMNMSNDQFIQWLGGVARDDYKTHKVLPSLTIAQGIIESGWGKSGLTQKANNLFGIKAGSSWTGETYNVKTAEYTPGGSQYFIKDNFRKYPNAEMSVADHGALLNNPRYAKVLQARDYKTATYEVRKAGYATDPGYSSMLNSMIEKRKLYEYDKNLPAYEQGTPWVPKTQVALLHKGEMVVPAEHNPLKKVMKRGETEQVDSTSGGSDNSDVVNALRWAVTRLERKLDELNKTTSQNTTFNMTDARPSSNRAENAKKGFSFT